MGSQTAQTTLLTRLDRALPHLLIPSAAPCKHSKLCAVPLRCNWFMPNGTWGLRHGHACMVLRRNLRTPPPSPPHAHLPRWQSQQQGWSCECDCHAVEPTAGTICICNADATPQCNPHQHHVATHVKGVHSKRCHCLRNTLHHSLHAGQGSIGTQHQSSTTQNYS